MVPRLLERSGPHRGASSPGRSGLQRRGGLLGLERGEDGETCLPCGRCGSG